MTAQPRVFHLITRLLKGGSEAKTIEAVLGLDGYEFTVGHGSEFDSDQVERLERNSISIKRFRTIRHYNPVTAIPAVGAVAGYLYRNEFEIVHTHSTEAGIIGRLAAALAGIPAIVHTVHGIPFVEDRNRVLNQFVLGCERVAAIYTDCLITNADAITREYMQCGVGHPRQYRTVYSGIDVDRFRKAKPNPEIDGSGVRVVMVGRFARGKGFPDLLAAIGKLSEGELSVYLVGDGPRREEIRREIERRGLSETVHVLGYREDVPEILAACDVFVLPSYREGTPRVITEAMASGLPVVATDIAGIPEQIQHGESGYLIPVGDSAELARRLEELVQDATLRERMGERGEKRAEQFSIEAMLDDLDEVYQELVGAE